MKIILLFLLSFTYTILPTTVQGHHIYGGEVTISSLGNDEFNVRVTCYHDCGKTNAPVRYFTVYDANNNRVTPTYITSSTLILKDELPKIINPCATTTSSDLCLNRSIYDRVISLPPIAGGYRIYAGSCCRSITMDNIQSIIGDHQIFWADIPDMTTLITSNESPIFNASPPVEICSNTAVQIDFSANDADGDFLVYKFCAPKGKGIGTSRSVGNTPPPYQDMDFNAPFSYSSPMNGGLSIDPNTGIITGTPPSAGRFLVGVCVEEYRNGFKIGEKNKEFLYTVVDCIPTIQSNDSFVKVCTGDEVQFGLNYIGVIKTGPSWDFGDPSSGVNNTSVLAAAKHTYNSLGIYKAVVSITDTCDNLQTDTTTVEVEQCSVCTTDTSLITPQEMCEGSSLDLNTLLTPSTTSPGSWSVKTSPSGSTPVIITGNNLTAVSADSGIYVLEYTIDGTITSGCPKSNTVQLRINSKPTKAEAGNDQVICSDTTTLEANITLIGTGEWIKISSNPATISSSQTATSQLAHLQQGSTNSFEWITRNGTVCPSSRDTVHITVLNKLSPTFINLQSDTLCEDSVYPLLKGNTTNADEQGTWTSVDPSISLTTNGLDAEIPNKAMVSGNLYQFIYTISNGSICPDNSDTLELFIQEKPSSATVHPQSDTLCEDSVYPLLKGNTTNAGEQGTWTSVDPSISLTTNGLDAEIPNKAMIPGNLYQFIYTISNGGICPDNSDTLELSIQEKPSIEILPVSNTCNASTFKLSAIASNYNQILWNDNSSGAFSTLNGLNTIYTPQNGQHSFIITATAKTNKYCLDSSTSVNINLNHLFVDVSEDKVICLGDSVQLVASGASDYKWFPNTNLSSDTVYNPIVTPQSTTTYHVEATNNNGCTGLDSVTVTVINNPDVTIATGSTVAICLGEKVELKAQGANQYTWGNQKINPITVSPTNSTNYHVVGTIHEGCKDTASVFVMVNSLPIIEAFGASVCKGESVLLHASGASNYSWSHFGSGNNLVVSPEKSTEYTVIGIDTNGCSSSKSIDVEISKIPSLNSELSEELILRGEQITFHTITNATQIEIESFPYGTLHYQGEVQDVYLVPDSSSAYLITGVLDNCSVIDSANITVVDLIKIPSMITPNGDGLNDYWEIENIQDYPNSHVTVYNRWGNVVFNKYNYSNDWEGINNGKHLPAAVYYYVIDLNFRNLTYSGSITIIR